jgi:hypothetical protein
MKNIELLDYFAGQVIQAMISFKTESEILDQTERQYYPRMAYFIANMMLQERENYFPTRVDVTTAKQIE